jgi:hypothetical protein
MSSTIKYSSLLGGNYKEYISAFRRYIASPESRDRLIQLDESIAHTFTKVQEAPVPKAPLPGEARDEGLELRLCQNREAKRVLEDNLSNRPKKKKPGIWSDYKIARLIELRKPGLPLNTLQRLLRRKEPDVLEKLRELSYAYAGPGVVEGPQELPPGLQESLFDTRLAATFQALQESDMTETWKAALQEKTPQEWLSRISNAVPERVKKMLGALRPPTWDEVEGLTPVDTDDTGVYARLVTSRHEIHMVSERYPYVGSASKYGGGISARIIDHMTRASRLQDTIKKKKLKGNGSFVTLMTMKMDSPDEEAVREVWRTVILAEAIFTVWLRAFISTPRPLSGVFPWNPETLQYRG